MTDSKTPDWVKAEAHEALSDAVRDERCGASIISQALLSAYERGRSEHVDLIDKLDSALCQFLNNAADEYDPSVWVPSVKRDFAELSKVYNECHVAGLMDIQRAARSIRQPRRTPMSGEKPLPVGVLLSGDDTPIATSEKFRAVKLHLPKTVCHREGGCIRAFEDDTCGDQGQCSIVLAASEAYERGMKEGIEEAAKEAGDVAAKNYGYSDGPGAARVLAAIRQLLEVKG